MTKPANEHSDKGRPQCPAPNSPTTSTTFPSTLAGRIERRRRDPEFQARLKRNIERHEKLLNRLADS